MYIVYGCMCILGLLIWCFRSLIQIKLPIGVKIGHILRQELCMEKVEKQEREYEIKRIGMFGAAIGICGILGIGYLMSENEGEKIVTLLERPAYGEGESNYNLWLRKGDSEETIIVNIPEKDLTEEEIKSLFSKGEKELEAIILGENKNFSSITTNMNFVSSVLDETIGIEYILDEKGCINYDGSIDFGKICFEDKRCETSFTVVYTLGNESREKEYLVTLIQPETDSFADQKELQEYVNESQEDKISLPERLGGEKVTFYNVGEKYEWIFLPIGIVFALGICFAKDEKWKKKEKERGQQLENDYCEFVTKINLLQGSGQSIRGTWEYILQHENEAKKSRYLYREMELAMRKIKNGKPEIQAYQEFGNRCGHQSYRRFVNILVQNIKRGSNSMREQMQMEVYEAQQDRIALAKKKAEECSTKLLVPMIMMLIVVIIILVVPAFLSISL